MGGCVSCLNPHHRRCKGVSNLEDSNGENCHCFTDFSETANKKALGNSNGNIYPKTQVFSYLELANATKMFRDDKLIGKGGFGKVYKGDLETRQTVAIKILDQNGVQGDKEFMTEVLMLSILKHSNLVNLIGYCLNGDQRGLVYEYMQMGSLDDHLFNVGPSKRPLEWNTRIKIALGAARGLEYLHCKVDPPVIHRDLKSSNILLDEDFNPKLSDFGLAKLGPVGGKSHVSTRVMGTHGYCAPEYAQTGQLTIKSDIFSFGVVLLELITGRKSHDSTRKLEERDLVAWGRRSFKSPRRLVDPILQGRFPDHSLKQVIALIEMCLQETSRYRPVISDVCVVLEHLKSRPYDPEAHRKEKQGHRRERRSLSGC